jgi:hypothetical protein
VGVTVTIRRTESGHAAPVDPVAESAFSVDTRGTAGTVDSCVIVPGEIIDVPVTRLVASGRHLAMSVDPLEATGTEGGARVGVPADLEVARTEGTDFDPLGCVEFDE